MFSKICGNHIAEFLLLPSGQGQISLDVGAG